MLHVLSVYVCIRERCQCNASVGAPLSALSFQRMLRSWGNRIHAMPQATASTCTGHVAEHPAPCGEGECIYNVLSRNQFGNKKLKKTMLFYTPNLVWGPSLSLQTEKRLQRNPTRASDTACARCREILARKSINLEKYLVCIQRGSQRTPFQNLTPLRSFAAFAELPPSAIPRGRPHATMAFSNPGLRARIVMSTQCIAIYMAIRLSDALPLEPELHGIYLVAHAPFIPW